MVVIELQYVFGLHILITCSIPSAQKSLISVLYSLHDCFFLCLYEKDELNITLLELAGGLLSRACLHWSYLSIYPKFQTMLIYISVNF